MANASGSMNFLGMFTVGDFPQLFSISKPDGPHHLYRDFFHRGHHGGREEGNPIVHTMDCMTEVIVKVIGIVMKLAPLGLGCYFAILIGQYGKEVIGPLSRGIVMYSVVVLVYYIISQTVMAYIGVGTEGVKAVSRVRRPWEEKIR